ncbi:ribosome maturation factor RimM [Lacrimispora amygdalina]|uniref:ribosome maturation factor RimM n=1 Tax=Lacrimispora amygdalina TaxID=253257 RepID=UPI000BE2BAB6|nr:ribosome maturation factor RimM [Lacrimispora amygdalina]
MENLLRVGVISSTHGIKGEVKVFPTTDDSARFKQLKKVILDTGREQIDLEIEGVKFFKNMVILKFKGYDSIDEIEKYKGRDLLITRDLAVELGPDENFITDLIGLLVVKDDGDELGTLTDVIKTGANDVYEVRMADGREVLLPAIKECVLNVDLEKGTITVHMMDGLLD